MSQPMLHSNQLLGINPGVRITQDEFLAGIWKFQKRIIQRSPVSHTVGLAVVQNFLVPGPFTDIGWACGSDDRPAK